MVIVDPPAAWTAMPAISETAIAAVAGRSPNAALYFPRLRAPDPLRGNQTASFAPCGAVAGIYVRIDGADGVWKARDFENVDRGRLPLLPKLEILREAPDVGVRDQIREVLAWQGAFQ